MKKNSKIITANVDNIRLNNEDDSIIEIEHILELKEGWNLVAGSILNACEIKDDNNIIEKEEGNFLIYKFSESGYTRGYSFQKGIGYWVRSGQDGQIKLVEKTEGIIKDETVETIGKTVVTIIESSNTVDQTTKDIENIVNPNSTQTSEEVKETINETGSTLNQQAEEGQNLVIDLDKAVENEDPKLLNDLLDQARASIPSSGRIKKNKRKGKKKLRIVNEVNKFDTMYNNGKSAEKHCGDWSNGNGEYAECSNSLKNYFISMNEVGNAAKNDKTGYETVTEYYKSNSSGSKIPNGNYQINANWDRSDTFHKIRIYYDELIYVDSDTWIYDRNRKLYTNAYQKDDYGNPVWNDDLESYQFTYTQESKWIKFFKVQDDTNKDDDSLYFGITDQYDSNPEKTQLGSFVGVKKEVDWVKYNFKNSENGDKIDILIGVLEAPIDSDIYNGSVGLDLNAFEIKQLVIKSSNQDIVDLFNESNTWTTGAENFDNDNFALHGGLDVKWDNQSGLNIYKTFSYDSNSYNFYIKFGDQIEIKMQNGTLYFNEFEYDVNLNDGFLFSEIEGTPDEATNDKFIEFNTTGGINDIWFENKQIDFTEELDWFRYSIENNSSSIPLEMIVEIGVSKNNVSDVTNFYKGDLIKQLKEIKEIIFKTSDSEILDKLEDFSWSSLENQNDNNYALFNPDDDAKEYPNSYNENYKFKIYGIKDNFDNNGNYDGSELIDLFLEKTPGNNVLGLQIGPIDNQGPLYKYAESASLNEKEISKPTDGYNAYKIFNTKGGLNKVYIINN